MPRGRQSLILGLLLSLAMAPAAGAEASAGSGAVAVHQPAASAKRALEYWTPARMRAARPLDVLVSPGHDGTGPPVRVPRMEATGAAGGPTALAAQIGDPTGYPQRTHGKVFLTIPGEGDFECSATAVRSPSHRLVITAGHCAFDEVSGRWADRWIFIPGYRDGDAPFRRWPARELATTLQWRSSGDFRYDVGAAIMRKRGGRKLQEAVGARGIAFNRKRDKRYVAYGYPAAPPFDGERLYQCSSDYLGGDQTVNPPRPMRIDCDMTAGASGGGWVIRDRYVVSVTSYGYACSLLFCPEPDKLFGPYFGPVVRHLYQAVKDGRP